MGNTQGREWEKMPRGFRPNDEQMLLLYRLQRKMYTRLVESPEHLALLRRYWDAMLSRRGQPAQEFDRISPVWCLEAGFSSENPAMDLRSMGQLGLECLVFFVENFPGEAKMMNRKHGGYPFAKTGVAIARALSEIFHLVNEHGVKGNFPVAETMYWQILDSDTTFFQLFALSFMLFEDLFCEEVARNRTLQALRGRCSTSVVAGLVDIGKERLLKALQQAPKSIRDLALICQNADHILQKSLNQLACSETPGTHESAWQKHYIRRKSLRQVARNWKDDAHPGDNQLDEDASKSSEASSDEADDNQTNETKALKPDVDSKVGTGKEETPEDLFAGLCLVSPDTQQQSSEC